MNETTKRILNDPMLEVRPDPPEYDAPEINDWCELPCFTKYKLNKPFIEEIYVLLDILCERQNMSCLNDNGDVFKSKNELLWDILTDYSNHWLGNDHELKGMFEEYGEWKARQRS